MIVSFVILILIESATKKRGTDEGKAAPYRENQLTRTLLVGLIACSMQPTPEHMLPTPPSSSTLALPVSVTGGSGRAVNGLVAHILFLAGIIVVGPLAALDLIIVLALVSLLLISLLILG